MRFKSAAEEEQHRPEAVLVRDGVIAALGSLDEIRKAAGPDADFLDLDGKCLMPGFIDPHSHFIMNGQTSMWADLSDCNSFAEIIDVLKDFRKQAGDPEAVIGFGYDHNFLKEGRHPDKRVLDQVSTEIPVFVIHVSVHFACGNSAVLKLAGIDGNTPDPEGGRYGRLAGSREPDGYLEETAMNPVFERFSRTSADLTPEQIAKMQETYLRFGVTTAQDGAMALITGESIGQVASQTIQSLAVTNEVCTMPVFRPLIGFDKNDIVDISRKIGTYETSILPYEDCCTIFVAKHPVTKPLLHIIERSEVKLNEKIDALVQEAIDTAELVIAK